MILSKEIFIHKQLKIIMILLVLMLGVFFVDNELPVPSHAGTVKTPIIS